MKDFDPYACSNCGLPHAEHKLSEGGAVYWCADGNLYWSHSKIRHDASVARRNFIREATLEAVRAGAALSNGAVEYGRAWDEMEEENERYFREWRPK